MRSSLIVVSLGLLAGVAHADCPVNKQVRVTVACTAEMMGMNQATFTLSEKSEPGALEVTGPSKIVRLAFGDYRLSGELQCSSKSSAPMSWGLKVELNKKGKPSPVSYVHVGASDAAKRKGGPPLEVSSYYFFEPSIDHPQKPGQKLTRLDYTCRLLVD